MALINCSECNKQISDTSLKCIGCGYTIEKKDFNITDVKKKKWWKSKAFVISTLVLLVFSITAIFIMTNNDTTYNESVVKIILPMDKLFADQLAITEMAYELFKSDGYRHEYDDFIVLIHENSEALQVVFNLFVDEGVFAANEYSDFLDVIYVNTKDIFDVFSHDLKSKYDELNEFPIFNYLSKNKIDNLYKLSQKENLISTTNLLAFKLAWSNSDRILVDVNSINEIKDKKAFDSNGNFMGSVNNNGQWEGIWKEYYDNNTLAIEGNYNDGLMNGEFKCYQRDGRLRHQGKFKNGTRNNRNIFGYIVSGRFGTHTFYYLSGNLKCKKNGNPVDFKDLSLEHWYPNGVKGASVYFKRYRYSNNKKSTQYCYLEFRKWDSNGLHSFTSEVYSSSIIKKLDKNGFYNY